MSDFFWMSILALPIYEDSLWFALSVSSKQRSMICLFSVASLSVVHTLSWGSYNGLWWVASFARLGIEGLAFTVSYGGHIIHIKGRFIRVSKLPCSVFLPVENREKEGWSPRISSLTKGGPLAQSSPYRKGRKHLKHLLSFHKGLGTVVPLAYLIELTLALWPTEDYIDIDCKGEPLLQSTFAAPPVRIPLRLGITTIERRIIKSRSIHIIRSVLGSLVRQIMWVTMCSG